MPGVTYRSIAQVLWLKEVLVVQPHSGLARNDATRAGRRPSADIEEGHRSTLLSQWANISYRLGGEKLLVDPNTETFSNNDQANEMLKRQYRKPWVIPDKV